MSQLYQPAWGEDSVLPGFEAATIRFPDDYDGPVYATLVRRPAARPSRRAVLYVHGFTDYFFQTHLADAFNERGYNFYALDLRKYGRSLHGAAHPNYCNDVREYFSEISAALRIIGENDGNQWILLSGHSTGGLTSALYADSGAERHRIDALALNSPFFAFNLDGRTLAALKTLAGVALAFPFARLKGRRPVPYVQSIHADHRGEWTFDLQWRPLTGFPLYAGWVRAILRAHARVRRGLAIACPVLVLHASASARGAEWNETFQAGDGVLDVDHIREGSRHLGPNVTMAQIDDGLHDLALSRSDVRERFFATLFEWLDTLPQPIAAGADASLVAEEVA
ncbi:MAG TPA: alpha/beta hydrolase [Herpetosiphonaceae bacterium]|nr:alpha/beta hydrolase [Herpetosiphonaceae bacterium]